ncbi:MAG: sugar ABC transporter permease [Lachnospiraceae bacterium]|nr:sugar ABC transporter permease [Lachnospiraceae bacterium]
MKRVQKLRSAVLRSKREAIGYVFVLPIIIGLAMIYLPSLYRAVKISLSEISYEKTGMVMEYEGLSQYYYAFRIDPDFVPTVLESMRNLLINIPTIVIFSFFMANVLNQKFVGRSIARAVFFLPVITATGILVMAEANDTIQMLYSGSGKLNEGGLSSNIFNYESFKMMFLNSSINQRYISFLFATIDRIYYIVTSSGVQILIFLAGLQSIPESMFEAAKMEGATSWEILWKITFPYISPLILVSVLYTIIETFYSFNNPIVVYINKYLQDPNNFAYGSAISLIYFAVSAVAIAVICLIINRFIVYQD